jgi:hypothetical protein
MNSMSVEFWNAAHSACGGYLAGRIRAWWTSRAPGSAGRKKPPAGRLSPEGASEHAPPGHLPTRRAYQQGGASIAVFLLKGLLVAACKQSPSGLPTRVDAGQRSVRRHAPVGQRSWRMSQHSCAKGLHTRPWANTHGERGQGWNINCRHASASPRYAVSKLNDRFTQWFIPGNPRLNSRFAHFLRGFKNGGRVLGAKEVHHGRDPDPC